MKPSPFVAGVTSGARENQASTRGWCQWWALLLIPTLLTGCETPEQWSLTCRLWSNEGLRNYSEPAPDPRLEVRPSTTDTNLWVIYDAFSERRAKVRRQAYALWLNRTRIEAGKAPLFVEPGICASFPTWPVFAPNEVPDPAPERYVVFPVSTSGTPKFSLHRDGGVEGPFDLPVYRETSGRVSQVLLSPFAVAIDTALVASVVGVVILAHTGYHP